MKIGNDHIKVLQRGDKAVVRQGAGILFNNLKTKDDFNIWWSDTMDVLTRSTDFNVVKNEVVDNKAMTKILAKYK